MTKPRPGIITIIAVLLVLGVVLYLLLPQVPFPSDAASDFDARLKSSAGSGFHYQIVALKNATKLNPNGPWCIQIEPGMKATSENPEAITHFSMLKKGHLWVMVPYDLSNQPNWDNLGCGNWE